MKELRNQSAVQDSKVKRGGGGAEEPCAFVSPFGSNPLWPTAFLKQHVKKIVFAFSIRIPILLSKQFQHLTCLFFYRQKTKEFNVKDLKGQKSINIQVELDGQLGEFK